MALRSTGTGDGRSRGGSAQDQAAIAALASRLAQAELDPAAAVAINARAAVREQIGGVERYAREMARRLPALRPERYVAIVPHRALAHRTGHLWEQVVLPLRTRRFALLYSPANVAPAAAPRNLAVIHDAAVLREPESYSRGYVAFHSRLLRRIVSQATVVITDSEFSRGELCELLGLPADRFRIVPAGVGESFASKSLDEQGRRKYGLHRPYVLSVATLSARKNLDVLDVASRLLSEHQIDLVVAGGGRSYMRERGSSLRRLGYVPEADLPALYAGARAFVMPSRYEGFGLPCLEAMASGVPVVAARAGALPETVGDAALLVGPSDAEGFADGLLRLVDDAQLRSELIAKGRARAKLLSWERTAVLTDELVSELIG